MHIFLSPQVSDQKIHYSFEGEKIIAAHNGKVDTFDFSGLSDGHLELFDEEGDETISTKLDINPIVFAKKEDGELYVELLNFIGVDATEEERFPDWIEHTEYVPLEETERELNEDRDLEGWDNF